MKKNSLPRWNLKDLYQGPEDKKIAADMKAAHRKAQQFHKRYQGNLHETSKRAVDLLTALETLEQIEQLAAKPLIFANLRFSEDTTDPARGALVSKARAHYVSVNEQLLFFTLELASLGSKKLKKLAERKSLSRFRNYLRKVSEHAKYQLDEAEERILAQKDLTGRSAFCRLFHQEFGWKRFTVKTAKKKSVIMTETEVLDVLHHPKRSRRKAAAAGFSQGLREDAPRLAYIFNTLLHDKAVQDSLRGYSTPESSRHLANQIDQPAVDALKTVVTSNYKIVQRYYRFKGKVLGIKDLRDYDRYAPLSLSKKSYSFAKAQSMVLDAFRSFDTHYADVAEEFFRLSWIDADPRPGKRGGAYCSFATPDVHPYVFLNYTGSLREIFILAHELGHALHAWFMRGQGYLNFDVPLTVAETASVFSEMLVFDYLRETITDPEEQLALHMLKIESIFATVYRQISMYEFEQMLHEAFRAQGELAVERINEIWRTSQTRMFGKSLELTADYDYWWAYIPHFIDVPFYVYAYAFGELLTLSLYGVYQREKGTFVDKYYQLLGAGDTKSPQELLRPFRISLRRKDFWEKGISMIDALVRDAQRIQKKL